MNNFELMARRNACIDAICRHIVLKKDEILNRISQKEIEYAISMQKDKKVCLLSDKTFSHLFGIDWSKSRQNPAVVHQQNNEIMLRVLKKQSEINGLADVIQDVRKNNKELLPMNAIALLLNAAFYAPQPHVKMKIVPHKGMER